MIAFVLLVSGDARLQRLPGWMIDPVSPR